MEIYYRSIHGRLLAMLSCDQYFLPTSLDEAFDIMDRHPGKFGLVAGATDLMTYARAGRGGDVYLPVLIDLTRIRELKGVELQDGRVRMGGATTIADFLSNPLLREHTPVMAHCAMWFADDQVRQAATLAGNFVNASPSADGTPPMVAMNAVLTLESRNGGVRAKREMPLEKFLVGRAKTEIRPGEIITAITCDSTRGYGTAFEKVGRRRSLVISVVSHAALVKVSDKGDHFEDVRLGMGAIGPVADRLHECESSLVGKPLHASAVRDAARLPGDRVRSRSRQSYRRVVVASFLEKAISSSLAQIGLSLRDDAGEKGQRYA
jgi:CO/xanthine dehydrogenase FAD-binding subunit